MRSRPWSRQRIGQLTCAARTNNRLRNPAEMLQNVATLDDCRICRLGWLRRFERRRPAPDRS